MAWKLHELRDPIFHHRQVLPGVRRTQTFYVAVFGILVVRHFAARDRVQNLLDARFDLPDRFESKRLPDPSEFDPVVSTLSSVQRSTDPGTMARMSSPTCPRVRFCSSHPTLKMRGETDSGLASSADMTARPASCTCRNGLHYGQRKGNEGGRPEEFLEASLNRSRACDQRLLLGGASSFAKNSAAISATCWCTASRSTPGLSMKNCGSCFFPASVPTSRNV